MSWFRSCVQPRIQRAQQRAVRRRSFRPRLEWLENRLAPAVHDTLNTALQISFAASPVAQVSDTLTTANQVDLYAVTLHQGDQLTAAINAQQQGSSLQAALRLFDSSGTELPATASSNGGDPQLTFSVPGSGTYYVGVSSSGDVTYSPTSSGSGSHGTTTGLYSLSVTDLLARFVNAIPLSSFGQVQGTLTGGQPQDYSVTVTKRAGHVPARRGSAGDRPGLPTGIETVRRNGAAADSVRPAAAGRALGHVGAALADGDLLPGGVGRRPALPPRPFLSLISSRLRWLLPCLPLRPLPVGN